MIKKILKHINNYFVYDIQYGSSQSNNTLTINKPDNVFVNQYIYIRGSRVDDGVYKITSKDGNLITVDEDFIGTFDNVLVLELSVPKELIKIAEDITNNEMDKPNNVKSEKLGNWGITYSDNDNWQKLYKNDLYQYKQVYNKLP